MISTFSRGARAIGAALALACGTQAGAQAVYVSPENQQAMHEAAMQSPGETVDAVIDLYSSVLRYRMPKTFVPAFQAAQPASFTIEFVPFGEDVRVDWSQMLTLQAVPGRVAAAMPARTMAERVADGVAQSCPDAAISVPLGVVEVAGSDQSYRHIFGCRSSDDPARSEVTMIQTMKRGGNLVIVQYAMRGAPLGPDAPILPEGEQARIAALFDALALTDNADAGGEE